MDNLPYYIDHLFPFTDLSVRNKKKQQEAIDLYNLSKQYPRKIKKQMKIKAQKDYNFWIAIDNYCKQQFNYIKL